MSEETRVTFYDDETHVHVPVGREPAVGDVIPAYRGNGPREGERIGWVVVRRVKSLHGSAPELDLHFTPDHPGEQENE